MHKDKVEILLYSWSCGFGTLQTLEYLVTAGLCSTPTEIKEFFAKEDKALDDYFKAYAASSNYTSIQPFG